jgi:hypothetical protein
MADDTKRSDGAADCERYPLSVRAYQRWGGPRLVSAAACGGVMATAGFIWGAILLRECGAVQLASQLAGSGPRFAWLTVKNGSAVQISAVQVADTVQIGVGDGS